MSKKISARKKAQIISKTDGRCAYCGIELFDDDDSTGAGMTVDHLTPKSRGGTEELGNLVLCCRSCNSTKGSKTLEEYRIWFTWIDVCREGGFSLSQLNWLHNNTDLNQRFPRKAVRFFFEGAEQ